MVMQRQQLVRFDVQLVDLQRNLRADNDSLALQLRLLGFCQQEIVLGGAVLHDFPQLGIFMVEGFHHYLGHLILLLVASITREHKDVLFVASLARFFVGDGSD